VVSSAQWKVVGCIAIAAALCTVAGRYAARAVDLSWHDYGEGPLLATVERMRAEPCSRHWFTKPPYTLSPYGPGYFATVATFSGFTPWPGTVIPGRLVALLAALATVAVIAGEVTRRTGQLQFGLFAGMLFLVSSVAASWVPFHRVDTMAVFFSVTACAAASSETRRGLVAAALLVAAGSLVKQTAALSAAPIFLHLLISRRFVRAMGFAGLVTALGAGLWLAVDWLSGGYYLTMALRGVMNRSAMDQGLRLAVGFLQSPTALAGVLVAGWLLKNEPREAVHSLFFLAFVTSTLLAVPAAMKEGASINYYLEPVALAALVVGMHGLPRLDRAWPRRTPAVLAVAALLLAIPGVGDFPGAAGRTPRNPAAQERVVSHFAHSTSCSPEWVLADGPWIATLLGVGARPVVNDPFLYRLLVDNGTLQADPLVAAMHAGQVPWLVLACPIERHREVVGTDVQRWPAEVIEAMDRLYVMVEEEGRAWIYRFEPLSALGSRANDVDPTSRGD